jgi:putative MFS transporter
MHITLSDVAAITSAGFFGMFVGAAIGGWFADFLGRRKALIWSVIWFSLFSILTGLSFNVPMLLITRFLTGVGMSALTVISITYLAELMPKDRRGRLQAATLAIGSLGVPIIAAFALLVIPLGPLGWRLVFAFGGLGLVFLIFTRSLPESPRWLLGVGQNEAAEQALIRIEEAVAKVISKVWSRLKCLIQSHP